MKSGLSLSSLKTVKSSITLLLFRLISIFSAFITQVLILKYFEKDSLGLYASCLKTLNVLSILLSFGTPNSLYKFLSNSSKEKHDYSHFLKVIFKICFLPSLGISVIILIILKVFQLDNYQTNTIYIVCLALPFYSWFLPLTEFYRAISDKVINSEWFRNILRPLLTISFIVIAYNIYAFDNIHTPAWILSISITITSVTLSVLILNILPRQNPAALYKISTLKYFVSSLPMMASKFTDSLAIAIPIWMLSLYSLNQTGEYVLIFQISSLTAIGLPISRVLFIKKLRSLFIDQEISKLKTLVKRINIYVGVVSLFFFIVINTIIPIALERFFEITIQKKIILLVVSIGSLTNVACGLTGVLLNMTENEAYLSRISALLTILLFVFCVIFVPMYGIFGAAISYSIYIILLNVLSIQKLYRQGFYGW